MAGRYSVVVSMLDGDKVVAQETTEETDDYELSVAEFEEVSDADFEDCLEGDDSDSDDEDDDEDDDEAAEPNARPHK